MTYLLRRHPLEAKGLLMSRAVTKRVDGRSRKLMFIDVKKAHSNPVCEDDVYLELPEECHCPPGVLWQVKVLDVWDERSSSSSLGEVLC
eukprot:11652084-Karenia_brevis.AAC.1